MIVYGLTESPYGGDRPITCGIFSTRDKAEEAKHKYEEEFYYLLFEIEEWKVDK